MARSSVVVVLLLLVMVVTCLLLAQEAEAGRRHRVKAAKKAVKRRLPIIVKDLEDNVTALWKEVKQLGQPVHVHLHGDGHVMDPHHHPHPHHDVDHHDHHSHDEGIDDKDDKHPHHHKHPHKMHDADEKDKKRVDDDDDDDDDCGMMKEMMMKMKGKENDGDSKDMIEMKKKMMMKMKKCKHHYHHHHGDEEEEEEEWEEKWMHGGQRETHVHIHLHTGGEGEESKHHHAEPALPQDYRYARCDVTGNSALPFLERQNIKGTIFFRQMPEQPLEAKANLKGFTVKPDEKDKDSGQHLRGLHGHEFGDLSKGCNSLGGHFNPSGISHGGPGDVHEHRHVGDFGNLEVHQNGTVMTSFTDDLASLFGSGSMLGRSIVIHAGPDDLGKGDSHASKASGNAGKRIACCVIVASSEPAGIW